MKKIVFFDLDGTLLTSEKKILEENKEAIKRAKENEIEVCICSGRPYDVTLEYQQLAGAGRYLIANNGAIIYDTDIKDTLFSCAIEKELCVDLYEFVVENNLFIRIDTKYGRYVNIDEYRIAKDILFTEDYKKFFEENDILQITVGSLDSNIIDDIENQITKNPNATIANRYIAGMLPVKLDLITIVNPSVSKGNAIIGLCKYLKIDLKDAIAFGDDNNDISMIEAVGHGVAMENAVDNIKKVAKEIITTNDEPGIAMFLDRLIEEIKE